MLQNKNIKEYPPEIILQIFLKHEPVKEYVSLGHIVFVKDNKTCSLDFQKVTNLYSGNALIIKAWDCDVIGDAFTYDDLQKAIITDLFLQGEENIMIPEGQGIVDITLTLLDDETNTPIVRFTKEHLKNTDLGEYYDFIS